MLNKKVQEYLQLQVTFPAQLQIEVPLSSQLAEVWTVQPEVWTVCHEVWTVSWSLPKSKLFSWASQYAVPGYCQPSVNIFAEYRFAFFLFSLVCFDTGVHVGTHWKLATSSSAKWMYFHIQIWEDISWQLETAPSFERCDLRSTNKVQSREWERTDFLLFRRIHNWWQDLDFTSEPVFQRGSCSSLELQQCASDYNFTAFFMPETIYLNSKSSLPAFWGKIKTNGWERILNPVKIETSTHKIKKYTFYSLSTMMYTYNHIHVYNMNSLFLWVVTCMIQTQKVKKNTTY